MTAPPNAEEWMRSRGWQPHGFQFEVWDHIAQGRSGLLHASTGSGKTYAVWLGLLQRAQAVERRTQAGTRILWITPMRALAQDTLLALQEPLADLQPNWQAQARTGDTSSAERARQERRIPDVLVTTPESLSLMLTREDAARRWAHLQAVVVDEWHELIGSKRGVQLQLALARLATWQPTLLVWGLSATLGNLQEALDTLVRPLQGGASWGLDSVQPKALPDAAVKRVAPAALVQGRIDKSLLIDTLLPDQPGRFSWGGHLGAQMLKPVVQAIESAGTCLVFTNTRSQAEIWYQLLLQERPDWAGLVALHHGSLDTEVRAWVEQGLKAGRLKAVVATSSLDLGVDFLPVERVLQIGSPKGVARLMQRAGRSGHAPGRPSRITLVPTNTMELVEAVAARRAAQAGHIESRSSPQSPMDVLVQHLVTVAIGGGFEPAALYQEVCRTQAYATLSPESFDWALAFVERGGSSLAAYPEYHRVQRIDGRCVVADRRLAQRHRQQVGTIVSDAGLQVKWASGGSLGTIEEGFMARLSPGDCFVFAGRVLEYVRTREMTVYVRKAAKPKGVVSTWAGSKMPLSTELADATLAVLGDVQARMVQSTPDLDAGEPELQAAWPMLHTQQQMSALPVAGRILVEVLHSREGEHLFLYPFAGRLVHTGLAQLLAWRLAQGAERGLSMSLSVNDLGLEIVSPTTLNLPDDVQALHALLLPLGCEDQLLSDILQSMKAGHLPQRRFREIARVAGLVHGGLPGARKSTRQIQASSSLFYEVFRQYDSGNELLLQAEREVLSQELDVQRMRQALQRLQQWPWHRVDLNSPSPFCLPLLVERLREQLSTEQLTARIQRWITQSALPETNARPKRTRGAGRASQRVRPQAGSEDSKP
ncbi:MAG: ligase-associated DNA damage response DEXH box helicase [Betaproteobacteria bacterium]|nr:ligase-associated DNA damage response DEXH box helicase [Betaproteobacteria bacterium]